MASLDAQRRTTFPRTIGQVVFLSHAAPVTHPVQPKSRLNRPDQYSLRYPRRTTNNVETPMDTVDEINIGMTRRPIHRTIPRCLALVTVASRVVGQISFRLDDEPSTELRRRRDRGRGGGGCGRRRRRRGADGRSYQQPVTEQTPGDHFSTGSKKIARKCLHVTRAQFPLAQWVEAVGEVWLFHRKGSSVNRKMSRSSAVTSKPSRVKQQPSMRACVQGTKNEGAIFPLAGMPAGNEKIEKALPDVVTSHWDPFEEIGLQNNCSVAGVEADALAVNADCR